jgi:hypothetical protein
MIYHFFHFRAELLDLSNGNPFTTYRAASSQLRSNTPEEHADQRVLFLIYVNYREGSIAMLPTLGLIQRQETLDLPYLTLLCDNLKNRMFLQNFFS